MAHPAQVEDLLSAPQRSRAAAVPLQRGWRQMVASAPASRQNLPVELLDAGSPPGRRKRSFPLIQQAAPAGPCSWLPAGHLTVCESTPRPQAYH